MIRFHTNRITVFTCSFVVTSVTACGLVIRCNELQYCKLEMRGKA